MVRYQGQLSTPGTSADIYIMMDVDQSTQEPQNNRTLNNYNAFLYKNNAVGRPFNLNNNASISGVINGSTVLSGGRSYDFRSPNNGAGATVGMGSGSLWVTHNADGTKSIACSISFSDPAGTLGSGGGSGSHALTRLYRMIWVKVAGVWRRCYPWVKRSGAWGRTLPFIKNAGTWKITS